MDVRCRVAPCPQIHGFSGPQHDEALEQRHTGVGPEGAEQIDVLLRGRVGGELRIAGPDRSLQIQAVLLRRGGEEVELAVDVGQAIRQHIHDAPA